MIFPAQGAEPERIVVSPSAGASVTVLAKGKEMQYAGGELGGSIAMAGDTLDITRGTLSQDGVGRMLYTTTETLHVTFDAKGNPKRGSGSGWKIQDPLFTGGQ